MKSQAEFDRERSWAATLASWGGLVLAGALFSLATLAPRVADLQKLRSRYAENQKRLVSLERQADDLARVAEALRTDPQFLTELAKLEFSGTLRDAEAIPVDPELRLGDGRAATNAVSFNTSTAAKEWFHALLAGLSTLPRVRAALLAVAMAIGFASLIGVREERLAVIRRLMSIAVTTVTSLTARYHRIS